ncbi:hypothetical protein [Natrinema salaciae]|uniref:hypothetical protein n=1 Tax=Natrinema salaciae TaxID=1186196 RepID=UPI000B823D0F|nr:hypothetical protein [Natrinema salaciae]
MPGIFPTNHVIKDNITVVGRIVSAKTDIRPLIVDRRAVVEFVDTVGRVRYVKPVIHEVFDRAVLPDRSPLMWWVRCEANGVLRMFTATDCHSAIAHLTVPNGHLTVRVGEFDEEGVPWPDSPPTRSVLPTIPSPDEMDVLD